MLLRYKVLFETARSQWKDLCSFLKMTDPLLKISLHASIQPVFLFFSVLFSLLKLVKILEELVKQVEKVECAYLKSVPVSSFGI